MALITLTSDFGESDHYVGAVKASILGINHQQAIVDITHNVQNFDLAHGAFVMRASFRSFPAGTVHIVAVDSVGNQGDKQLAVQLEDHFFLLTDNGLLGLISDSEPQAVVQLNLPDEKASAFPARDILGPAAAKLANGTAIEELGTVVEDYQRMLGRKLRATKEQIQGHVIRVDHYGNLITNIEREVFCQLSKDKRFRVVIGREQFRRINESINETGSGDCFIIFNSLGLLEIGINKGHAAQLLGLRFDSPVKIIFED